MGWAERVLIDWVVRSHSNDTRLDWLLLQLASGRLEENMECVFRDYVCLCLCLQAVAQKQLRRRKNLARRCEPIY